MVDEVLLPVCPSPVLLLAVWDVMVSHCTFSPLHSTPRLRFPFELLVVLIRPLHKLGLSTYLLIISSENCAWGPSQTDSTLKQDSGAFGNSCLILDRSRIRVRPHSSDDLQARLLTFLNFSLTSDLPPPLAFQPSSPPSSFYQVRHFTYWIRPNELCSSANSGRSHFIFGFSPPTQLMFPTYPLVCAPFYPHHSPLVLSAQNINCSTKTVYPSTAATSSTFSLPGPRFPRSPASLRPFSLSRPTSTPIGFSSQKSDDLSESSKYDFVFVCCGFQSLSDYPPSSNFPTNLKLQASGRAHLVLPLSFTVPKRLSTACWAGIRFNFFLSFHYTQVSSSSAVPIYSLDIFIVDDPVHSRSQNPIST
ncbi:hypothetical protein CROQUDRAFT_90088 [Cronartium quercuum f. sp. fusiforme G11]|uniref:Uncharacterized protein n=1 Tax=Cronartium quercuum f. sp. fusiforme G11 TaxID=708437 RepID=A0A9P6NKA9_9BASI|nr:hypothetical protein CROQUDRAFT_90088 [Cronartium quercuum f. sp. fusiforme G11]